MWQNVASDLDLPVCSGYDCVPILRVIVVSTYRYFCVSEVGCSFVWGTLWFSSLSNLSSALDIKHNTWLGSMVSYVVFVSSLFVTSSLLLLVSQEGCAAWLWHFLDNILYLWVWLMTWLHIYCTCVWLNPCLAECTVKPRYNNSICFQRRCH